MVNFVQARRRRLKMEEVRRRLQARHPLCEVRVWWDEDRDHVVAGVYPAGGAPTLD